MTAATDARPAGIALAGISGSLRARSFGTAVLETLRTHMRPGVTLTLLPLRDVPLYDEDQDGPRSPPGVVALRHAIAAADALVVVSPEYNHGMSGVLKNAIDWASRPSFACALTHKPVSVMTVGGSPLGGVRAQAQLRETFAATLSRVMANRQVVIGNAAAKIVDGRLVDRPTIDFALAAIDELVAEVALLRAAGLDAN